MLMLLMISPTMVAETVSNEMDAMVRRYALVLLVLKTCQIDKDNLHKWRFMECMGFGEAISNITLEPKP